MTAIADRAVAKLFYDLLTDTASFDINYRPSQRAYGKRTWVGRFSNLTPDSLETEWFCIDYKPDMD